MEHISPPYLFERRDVKLFSGLHVKGYMEEQNPNKVWSWWNLYSTFDRQDMQLWNTNLGLGRRQTICQATMSSRIIENVGRL